MNHRKVLSQGNVPFSWEESPFCFRDFQALALHSSPLPPPHISQFDVVSKIPPPPCRLPPRSVTNAVSAKEEDDPFLAAYKECTKSAKNGKFVPNTGNKGAVAVVKKSKFFGFSCKSIVSCEIRDASFFKLRRDRIHVSTWK